MGKCIWCGGHADDSRRYCGRRCEKEAMENGYKSEREYNKEDRIGCLKFLFWTTVVLVGLYFLL